MTLGFFSDSQHVRVTCIPLQVTTIHVMPFVRVSHLNMKFANVLHQHPESSYVTHGIHVWYVLPSMVDFDGQCRVNIPVPWILWVNANGHGMFGEVTGFRVSF